MNIIKSSCAMKLKPDENSELETECLFGEKVKIHEHYLEWVYCKLDTDNYLGWVKKNNLGYLPTPTHRVINKRTFLLKNNNAKSVIIQYLPLGSQLCVKKIEDNWAKISLSDKNEQKFAYVPVNHIIGIREKHKDWVNIAESLLDTPYKWGGRDTMGLDCSALLQLSYQTYGENIPRNTSDQIKCNKTLVSNINKINRGSVVFWKGHVGIMIDKLNCLHANAFHMKTTIESLKNVNDRIGKESKILKIMNFNNE